MGGKGPSHNHQATLVGLNRADPSLNKNVTSALVLPLPLALSRVIQATQMSLLRVDESFNGDTGRDNKELSDERQLGVTGRLLCLLDAGL